jgi:hypothetical protein
MENWASLGTACGTLGKVSTYASGDPGVHSKQNMICDRGSLGICRIRRGF